MFNVYIGQRRLIIPYKTNLTRKCLKLWRWRELTECFESLHGFTNTKKSILLLIDYTLRIRYDDTKLESQQTNSDCTNFFLTHVVLRECNNISLSNFFFFSVARLIRLTINSTATSLILSHWDRIATSWRAFDINSLKFNDRPPSLDQ